MDRHSQAVESISTAVRSFFERGESFRVSHGSSNSTRPGHGATRQNVVDISKLSNVLKVDTERQIALVEPNVPMDRLVEATLEHNLVPPVVMEFPGITVGGGFSGTSGESSSFRHGFFDDTVNRVEMVLGNGDIVWASREERADLFRGAAGAAGTLGMVTLVELRLVQARKFVRTTYHRFNKISDAISKIQSLTEDPDIDYIDGIVFSPDHSVIITGQLTDTKPPAASLRTFSNADDPWFYMYVQDKTRDLEPSPPPPELNEPQEPHSTPSSSSSTTTAPTTLLEDYIPLGEYLFRYDRAGFWVGRQGYTYFKIIPFTAFFRWLLDDFSHTRTLYHALHAGGIASRFVVQDLALPYSTAERFIGWVERELDIWPLWLCPLRGGVKLPSFHPVTAGGGDGGKVGGEGRNKGMGEGGSQAMLNIGVWGWGPSDPEMFVEKNREMERVLGVLRGRKWLYARTYYTEEEFWGEYGHGGKYEGLREKYMAMTLPTVYDKVKGKDEVGGVAGSGESWLRAWPIGGVYGMVKALFSGDISLHRGARWRYKGE